LLAAGISLDAASRTVVVEGSAGADVVHVSQSGGRIEVTLSVPGSPEMRRSSPGPLSAEWSSRRRGQRHLRERHASPAEYSAEGATICCKGWRRDDLFGDDGNDTLIGGGADRLHGGGGTTAGRRQPRSIDGGRATTSRRTSAGRIHRDWNSVMIVAGGAGRMIRSATTLATTAVVAAG
jgi:hypothetical protein